MYIRWLVNLCTKICIWVDSWGLCTSCTVLVCGQVGFGMSWLYTSIFILYYSFLGVFFFSMGLQNKLVSCIPWSLCLCMTHWVQRHAHTSSTKVQKLWIISGEKIDMIVLLCDCLQCLTSWLLYMANSFILWHWLEVSWENVTDFIIFKKGHHPLRTNVKYSNRFWFNVVWMANTPHNLKNRISGPMNPYYFWIRLFSWQNDLNCTQSYRCFLNKIRSI